MGLSVPRCSQRHGKIDNERISTFNMILKKVTFPTCFDMWYFSKQPRPWPPSDITLFSRRIRLS